MRIPTALLALALLLAACSDPGTGSPASSAAPSTSPAPATTTPAPPTTPAATTTMPAPDGSATTTVADGTTTTTAEPTTLPLADASLRLEVVADGFRQPVFATAPPGDDRLFVVDQPGTIEVLRGGERIGPFLDVSSLVTFGGEQGLLGMAFHPDYPADPRFYVHYSDLAGANSLVEYRVSADPDVADPDSARVLARIDQPASNHNGGMLAFGPDGLLYVALGDGGGADDQFGNGQDTDTLLGTISRIDVGEGGPYTIPADNPFADGGGAPEIWAYGLRNPWRFSFDGDRVFIADVGQRLWEEINVVDVSDSGANFGWPIMEAGHCFSPPDCDPAGLTLPVFEYPHDAGRCSVTGGYVYRGSAIPELSGAYFFGDFCSGLVSSLHIDGEGVGEIRDWPDLSAAGLTSFGLDGAGELYLLTASGTLLRVERA